ncbi:hypothetical protein VNI00_010895 [Paramarasmius palmivorus]|uniref:Uncharacterized protein n=1 Tax=Paramarasmius palmivorus TaxID=297713 RepID=A0AAW0CFC1_9AGAR
MSSQPTLIVQHQEALDDLRSVLQVYDAADASSPRSQSFRAQVDGMIGERFAITKRTSKQRSRTSRAPNTIVENRPSQIVQAKEDRARERAQEIVQQASQEPQMEAKDYLSFLLQTASTHEEREHVAFVRLLAGYSSAGDWQTVIESIVNTEEPNTYLRWMEGIRSVDNDRIRLMALHKVNARQSLFEMKTRLIVLIQNLVSLSTEAACQALYQHIALVLGSLEFACDWAQYTKQDQGKKKKTQFYWALFAKEQELDPEGTLSVQDLENIATRTHPKEYQTWYNRNSQLVTGRNRLLELYDSYGVGVLMDPFWNPLNITNNARSKSFAALIAALATIVEPLNLSAKQESCLEVTSIVINTLDPRLGTRFLQFHDRHHTLLCSDSCDVSVFEPEVVDDDEVANIRRIPTPDIPGRGAEEDLASAMN